MTSTSSRMSFPQFIFPPLMMDVCEQRRETDAHAASCVVGVELLGNISGDPGGRLTGSKGSDQARFRHLLAKQGTRICRCLYPTQKWIEVDKLHTIIFW